MPTFERCSSCVSRGVDMQDSPIVPEGQICAACEASDRIRGILSTCKDHNFSPVCADCEKLTNAGRFVGKRWLCAVCAAWGPPSK